MLGPFATASRRTPPVLQCHSPGVATVARRLRIDVHNNIDNNDNNVWQRGPLWPHGMGPIMQFQYTMRKIFPVPDYKVQTPHYCTTASALLKF